MASMIPRRAFLRTMAGTSVGLPLALQAADTAASEPSLAQLRNQFFEVWFDLETGQFLVWRRGREPVLLRATARVNTPAGPRSTADAEYARTARRATGKDPQGAEQQLIVRCADKRKQLDLELRFSLYDGRDALLLETIARNVSPNNPLLVPSLEPVRATIETGGSFCWPTATKVLTNGLMYYDAGRLKDLRAGEKTRSWWNLAFYAGEKLEGLVIGFLRNQTALGQITLQPGKDATPTGALALGSLLVESLYEREFVLQPGASVSSDPVLFTVAPDPFTALEAYAQAVGDAHRVRLNAPINGWCSWFSFFGAITEAEVVRQAEFAARHLKPFGFEYIQLDDGFYRAFGDWEGNERFPHGMKWLAQRIRDTGLKPGLWLAPYVIAEGTEVHRQHPDWLVHHSTGKLKQIGPGLIEGSPAAEQAQPKLYALDITHPGAARWLRNLFATAAADWGYDFFKIDFVEWSLLAAERYYDPSCTKAAIYRRGVQIMREAIGPRRHLLDCGPGATTVGLLDSMRIELDQPPVTWNQYFLQSASSAPAAAKRYYFHNRTWINDADHVVLSSLTMPQAQAAASVIALSGGNMIAGDRLTDLDVTRLEILKKVFPSVGEAARPIDLFERDRPEIFAQRLKRPFGEWIVLGLFNADEQAPAEKTIRLDRLGLDPTRVYVAFDFWGQRLYGEVRGELRARLQPASVLLLALHERRGVPQVVSTDRHVAQGAVELENAQWDAATSTLRGISLGAPGTDHNVYVYLPTKHPWVQRDPFFFYDFPDYTLKLMEDQILRIQVRFTNSNRVVWEVHLKKFFGE